MGRIQKHADELEQKVRERTSELTKANRMLTNENQHRIRAEISLNESKNHLHAITEAIPIPFIISRISDGKILYSNSHCSPFFNAVQQTGEPLTIFNLFADRETIRDLLTLTKEKKHLPNIELSPQTLSRSFAWVLSTFQLLTFQGMESVILVFYDITERKQIEKLVAEIREKEQRRIGQDLHDDICQKLAGISVMVAVLEERLKKQKSEEARTAAGISELINDSIIQVKNIAKGLYPAELEQNQLATVLQNYSLKITEQFGVRCDFASNCREFKFDDFVSLHYYRIVQEAVNNAVRHAQPKTIKIALLASRLQTAVVIRDDGKGMPSGFTRTEGFGLRIMSYRANLIGAKLIIKPNRDHGTYVSCVMKNK
jgi:signal transduction histidine kinase